MGEHPIQGLMKTALENLQEMTDVNTIIGDPIETSDGHVILTVSKVGFGFAAGGSNFKGSGQSGGDEEKDEDQEDSSSSSSGSLPFGGGSGGGVSITPIAFLIVGPKGIQTIHLDNSTHLFEKMMDLAPQALEKIQQVLKSNKKDSKPSSSDKNEKSSHNGGGVVRRKNSGEEPQDDVYN